MKLEILVSCMNQMDYSILDEINIQSDVVVINQCGKSHFDEFKYKVKNGNEHNVKFFSVDQVGLSKSRNKALSNSSSDICLLCDDDEFLFDGSSDLIINAFIENPSFDIIAFGLDYSKKKYPNTRKKLGRFDLLKINSPQIAFKRDRVIGNELSFDELMGSGTGNGGGEENKFLMDCYNSGLKILFLPEKIARINSSSPSLWNSGFDERYFINRGWSTRRILGLPFSFLYSMLFTISKYKMYKSKVSLFDAFKLQVIGILKAK